MFPLFVVNIFTFYPCCIHFKKNTIYSSNHISHLWSFGIQIYIPISLCLWISWLHSIDYILYVFFFNIITQCYFDAKYQNRLALTTQAIGHPLPILFSSIPPFNSMGSLFQFYFLLLLKMCTQKTLLFIDILSLYCCSPMV